MKRRKEEKKRERREEEEEYSVFKPRVAPQFSSFHVRNTPPQHIQAQSDKPTKTLGGAIQARMRRRRRSLGQSARGGPHVSRAADLDRIGLAMSTAALGNAPSWECDCYGALDWMLSMSVAAGVGELMVDEIDRYRVDGMYDVCMYVCTVILGL